MNAPNLSLLHDQSVLEAIGPLREAGFALHYLHPKTKRPIGEEWSTAPAASLDALRRTHVAGNNLGVRCGEPSAMTAGGYLHAFDLDIRIAELAPEAWNKFSELFPDIDPDAVPLVASGSGGESRHIYFITDKPFRSKKLAVSDGKHRSADGKWHCDWEIELFGTGKQIALPPSIHPDTGQPYRWLQPFDFSSLALGIGPHVPAADIERIAPATAATYAYEEREPLTFAPGQLERDLDAIEVSDLHYDDWIRLGQALHHQFGGSEEGFDLWLLHTKRSKKFTGDRQVREMRRSKWRSFGKYRGQPVTMGTVRQWAIDARTAHLVSEFDDLPERGPERPAARSGGDFNSPGPPAADGIDVTALLGGPVDPLACFDIDSDDETIGPELDWMSLLAVTADAKGWANTLHNVELIVRHDVRFQGLPQLNEFIQETVQRQPPGHMAPRRANAAKPTRQLGGPVWNVRDPLNGDLWGDERDNAIRSILEAPRSQGGYGIKVTDRDLKAAVDSAARFNAFHPVREYLEGLRWDGQPRIDTFLIRYLGAPDNPYSRGVARLTLLGGVTRIFEPGAKFDWVLILEGLQGKRKSTFVSLLARHWFSALEGNLHDRKAMVEKMIGSWLIEMPELQGFSKYDVQEIKAFVSCSTDKVRLAYDRRAREFPRQSLLIGTTNEGAYLKDQSGGRRFWPLACTVAQIDTDAFAKEVDDLWAEAVVAYRQMRSAQPIGMLPLYLTGEALEHAEHLQESRRVDTVEDVYVAKIEAWLNTPIMDGGFEDEGQPARYRDKTCVHQLWTECLSRDITTIKESDSQVISRAIRQVEGWGKTGTREKMDGYGRQRIFARLASKSV
jgi:predicted P-loop ATPase